MDGGDERRSGEDQTITRRNRKSLQSAASAEAQKQADQVAAEVEKKAEEARKKAEELANVEKAVGKAAEEAQKKLDEVKEKAIENAKAKFEEARVKVQAQIDDALAPLRKLYARVDRVLGLSMAVGSIFVGLYISYDNSVQYRMEVYMQK